jgi:hypothetical protein
MASRIRPSRSKGVLYKTRVARLDDDIVMGNDFRVVQFTPRVQGARSRSARESRRPGLGSLIVSDIEATHKELVARGINASQVFHGSPFLPAARISGPAPERQSYRSNISFRRSRWQRVDRPGGHPSVARSRRCATTTLHQQSIWQGRQPPTASTRSATGSATRTGWTGTQRTWRRSRQRPSCRCERRSACN